MGQLLMVEMEDHLLTAIVSVTEQIKAGGTTLPCHHMEPLTLLLTILQETILTPGTFPPVNTSALPLHSQLMVIATEEHKIPVIQPRLLLQSRPLPAKKTANNLIIPDITQHLLFIQRMDTLDTTPGTLHHKWDTLLQWQEVIQEL